MSQNYSPLLAMQVVSGHQKPADGQGQPLEGLLVVSLAVAKPVRLAQLTSFAWAVCFYAAFAAVPEAVSISQPASSKHSKQRCER